MSENPIEFDSILDLCQHQHRRIVLEVLADEQQPVSLDDLTKAIFKYNHRTPIAEASEDDLTNIRVSLTHVHLPRMAADGFIHYDSERQLVEPIEQTDSVQSTLSTILAADPSLEAPVAPQQ